MSDQLHKEAQSTAEAMLTVAERLSDKIDRVTVAVDEGYGNDVQIVVDRMSEAMQAMSGAVAATRPPGSARGLTLQEHLGLAALHRPEGLAVALDLDPALEQGDASLDVDRLDAPAGDDLLAEEDRRAELRREPADRSATPAQRDTHAERCPIVNIPWATMLGNPAARATSSS